MIPKACPLVRVLAAAALLGGCYVGLDDESTGQMASTSTTVTPDPTTGTGAAASTGDEESTTTVGVSGTSTTGSETTSTTGFETTTSTSTTTSTTSTTTSTSTTEPDTTTSTTSTTTGMPDPNPDVPDVPYCVPAADWMPAWKQLEEDILVIVNQKRAQGANCGAEGNFGPTGPLAMDPALRCAARMHSKDMADRNFFNHTNPDGEGPSARIAKTGYDWSTWGENIAAGSPDAAGTMNQWMNSAGHCANIMNPNFEHIGVGYHPGGQYGHLWTQVFGAN